MWMGWGTDWALSDLGAVSWTCSALLRRPKPRHHARQRLFEASGLLEQTLRESKRSREDGRMRCLGHCHGQFLTNRGGALEMAMVISLSHQARMACYHSGSHKNGSAKRAAEQGTAGRQKAAGSRPVSQAPRPLRAALHHLRLGPPCP